MRHHYHFYSHLNREILLMQIMHIQKEFKIKKECHDCHDLYVQSNTLLSADVFQNFGNIFLEVYELDPGYFLSAPGLVR